MRDRLSIVKHDPYPLKHEVYSRRRLIRREQEPVTICVAAVCETRRIFAASDRLITAGDIQFQPEQKKMYQFTTSNFAMWSGDAALAQELLDEVAIEVKARVVAQPKEWWKVKDICALYQSKYLDRSARSGAAKFLAPLGLTSEKFVQCQKEMALGLVKQLATELINFHLPNLSVMFCGIDETGPHIFVANNAEITDCDAVGFAAIGIGYWHAESQLMFAGHSKWAPESKTLWMTYLAKKRSEVAPGIGQQTDMLMVGPQLGSIQLIKEEVMTFLEDSYRKMTKSSERQAVKVEERVDEFVKNLNAAETAVQAVSAAKDSATPASKADIH